MKCPDCGMMHYPKVSPAVIVRVIDGERILLARSPGFPKGLYSVLAGFVEPGESMEETVRREVREEVGIEVSDDEVKALVREQAEASGDDPDEVIDELWHHGRQEDLREDLRLRIRPLALGI